MNFAADYTRKMACRVTLFDGQVRSFDSDGKPSDTGVSACATCHDAGTCERQSDGIVEAGGITFRVKKMGWGYSGYEISWPCSGCGCETHDENHFTGSFFTLHAHCAALAVDAICYRCRRAGAHQGAQP